MTILLPEQTKSTLLYENDFDLWLEQTINQLKNQQFEQLDLEHLIEELTDLGKSNKRSNEYLLDCPLTVDQILNFLKRYLSE